MLGFATLLGAIVSFAGADSIDERAPKAPEVFVENLGQFDARAAFVCRAGGTTIFATEGGFRVAAVDFAGHGAGVFFSFGEHGVTPAALAVTPGRHHFFRGSDPAAWVTDARGFEGVAYRDVRPGVDVILHAGASGPTFDFVLAPGADVADLPTIAIDGVDRVQVTADGGARLDTAIGSLSITRPISVATAQDGSSRPLASHFELANDSALRVVVDRPHEGERLLIDPSLVFASYLGGSILSGSEYARCVAVDDSGAPIVAGHVEAADFPVTAGAFDVTPNGFRDVSVTKFAPDGSALVFSTLIGGMSYDEATGIACGADGSLYVTGDTQSPNFPVTAGAFDTTYSQNGLPDGFLVHLAAGGNALSWSTLFGGISNEYPNDVVVDAAGNAFVVGQTNSTAYPVTPGALDTVNAGNSDAFVTKFAPGGNSLVYSTLLGESGVLDSATSVAVSAIGEAFVTGFSSPGFPFTHESYDPAHSGGGLDAFVVRLNAAGSGLVAGTFLGGPSDDHGAAIAIGGDGNVTVFGEAGILFPTTPGAYDTSPAVGFNDLFIARLDPSLEMLVYSTFLGSDQDDDAKALVVDAGGGAIVCGIFLNGTTQFPTTPGALATTLGYSFLTRLDPTGSSLTYSTFLSNVAARPEGLAVLSDGSVIVAGQTSSGFPVTAGAYDTTIGNNSDDFVAKFDLCPGAITSHGTGCVGSGGLVPALAVKGCASPGFELTVDLSNALGHTSALLLLGLGSAALPLNGSCSLVIGPLVPAFVIPITLLGAGPGAGAISFPATVPQVPTPFDVHLQAVVVDPSVAGGLAASNAVKIHIDR